MRTSHASRTCWGSSSDRVAGREDRLGSGVLDDVADVAGPQQQGRRSGVGRRGELAQPRGSLWGLQERPDFVDDDNASTARGSVGQLLQDDLGDQPRDVGLRGAWIAQVEHRAVAVQGAGGEPIEHLG